MIAILVTIALSILASGGDYFLKLASQNASPYTSSGFFLGLSAHGIAAAGWVWVLQHLKLAYVGVFYCVSIVLLLSVIGWIAFDEKLRPGEILGVALAIVSLVLLARLA